MKENVHSLQELEETLKKDLPTGKVAFIGGHYPLNSDAKADLTLFGVFPEYTMQLARRLLRPQDGIALLVDDHSHMQRRNWYIDGEDAGNAITKYFANFTLPKEYAGIESRLIPSNGSPVFQESKYRRLFIEKHGIDAGCSGEFNLIMQDIELQGYTALVGLIPQRCIGPTCTAIHHYRKTGTMAVTCAYLPTGEEFTSINDLENYVSTAGIQVRKSQPRAQ